MMVHVQVACEPGTELNLAITWNKIDDSMNHLARTMVEAGINVIGNAIDISR